MARLGQVPSELSYVQLCFRCANGVLHIQQFSGKAQAVEDWEGELQGRYMMILKLYIYIYRYTDMIDDPTLHWYAIGFLHI